MLTVIMHHAPAICAGADRQARGAASAANNRGELSGMIHWWTDSCLGYSEPWNRWPFWVNHPSFSSHQLMIELGCIASVIWVVKPNFQPETVVIFVPAYSLHVWCFFEELQFTFEVCWHPLTSRMFTPKTPAFCCTKGNSAEQSWKDLITT
jgi:hypothetical protein